MKKEDILALFLKAQFHLWRSRQLHYIYIYIYIFKKKRNSKLKGLAAQRLNEVE